MDSRLQQPPHHAFHNKPPLPKEHKPLPNLEELRLVPPPPHHQPLHQKFKKGVLIKSIILGAILAALVGLMLNFFQISINVILPVLAPIWVGSITLFYQVFKEK
ncbi:hypothetical protein KJ840_05400 [Patescibacteria group bacterium]|nr:hypothetical protein [Patescibacteria group bacterium]